MQVHDVKKFIEVLKDKLNLRSVVIEEFRNENRRNKMDRLKGNPCVRLMRGEKVKTVVFDDDDLGGNLVKKAAEIINDVKENGFFQ